MRRGWVACAAMAAVIGVTACTNEPLPASAPAEPGPSASTGMAGVALRTPNPAVAAADPVVTRRTCTDAVRVAGDGLYVFNTQMATLERAAARDDQTAIIQAATMITTKLTELSATFTALSRRPVSLSVRATLIKASATVAGLGGVAYQGTPADQRAALTRVKASLVQACT